MRENIRNLVALFSKCIPFHGSIVEIGSLQVSGQEGFADMRQFFKDQTFIGCDMRLGTGVDRIENVLNLNFPDNSIETVLMLDTLEHVSNPFKAISEIRRVLKPGGILLMTSVMYFPIHEYPFDYWRFTPQGFQELLRDYEFYLVGYQGEPSFPHTVIGLGAKAPLSAESFMRFKNASSPEIIYIS